MDPNSSDSKLDRSGFSKLDTTTTLLRSSSLNGNEGLRVLKNKHLLKRTMLLRQTQTTPKWSTLSKTRQGSKTKVLATFVRENLASSWSGIIGKSVDLFWGLKELIFSRLCAKSVCASCSSEKIDSNRIDDICFLKHTNHKMEIQKKNYLKSLATWTKDLDTNIVNLKRTLAEKETKLNRESRELESCDRELQRNIAELEMAIENEKRLVESKE